MEKMIPERLFLCRRVIFFRMLLVLSIFLLRSVHIAAGASGVQDPRPSSKELVETVIAGINHNDSQMLSIRATFEVSVENIGLDKEISQTSTLAAGRTAKLVIKPKNEFRVQYILRGDAVKLESQDAIFVSKKGTVTYYSSESKSAWINRLQKGPVYGFPPPDIRQIGVVDDVRSMVQILQEDKILAAEFVEVNQKRIVRVTLEASNGLKIIYEFDPSRNMLPTTSTALNSDGSTGELVLLDYQECVPGAWILKRAKLECFPSKGGRFSVKMVSSLQLKELNANYDTSDQDFELDLPKATLVHDNVQGKTYFVGGTPDAPHISPVRKWLWVLFMIPLVALLLLRVAKRFKWFRFGNA